MRYPSVILLSVLSCLAVACTKTAEEAGIYTVVSPKVSLAGQKDVSPTGTKAVDPNLGPVLGSSFTEGRTYSLWMCVNGKFTEYNTNTNNVKAAYMSDKWIYRHNNGAFDFTELIIRRNGESDFVDFYAYSPFVSGVTDLKDIHYDVASQLDIMYAAENSGELNKGKDVTAEGVLSPSFRFEHSLSLIRFKIKNRQPGSIISLDGIWLKDAEGEGSSTAIYTSGSFNAITGEVSGLTTGVASAAQNIKIAGDEVTAYFLLIPSECGTNGVDAGFVLNGVGGDSSPYNRFRIEQSDLRHESGGFGFKAGCVYTICCEIDNYVHISGVSIKDGWEVENMEEKEI